MRLSRLTLMGFITCALIVTAASFAPAGAHGLAFASMVPLGAVLPSPGALNDIRREHLRSLPSMPVLRPFEGRPAATRDLEAQAVREALKPINPLA